MQQRQQVLLLSVITQTSVLVEFGVVVLINILLVFFISLIVIPSFMLTRAKRTPFIPLRANLDESIIAWMEKVVPITVLRFAHKLDFIVAAVRIIKIQTTGNIVMIYQDDPIAIDLNFFEDNLSW